jgi:hypothetical protein
VNRSTLASVAALIVIGAGQGASQEARPAPTALAPKSMARIGNVDSRFQSYNVEMIEVTGGKFWKPYSSMASRGLRLLPRLPHRARPAVSIRTSTNIARPSTSRDRGCVRWPPPLPPPTCA